MLTDTKIRALREKGLYGDGHRLYLQVKGTKAKSWMFRWKANDKGHYMGLGPYPAVSLKAARAKASACNELLASGKNPLEEQRRKKAEDAASLCTFEVLARRCASARSQAFRSKKHEQQWLRTLELYAFPRIGNLG